MIDSMGKKRKILEFLFAALLFMVQTVPARASGIQLKRSWLLMSPLQLKETANYYMRQRHRPDSALYFHTLLTQKIGEDHELDKEERAYMCSSFNNMAYIFMFYYYDYGVALENLIKARQYCDNDSALATINYNFGSIYSFYALCFPTAQNVKKAHDFSRQAFYLALKSKRWTTAIGAFMNLWYFDDKGVCIDQADLDAFARIPVVFKDDKFLSDRLTYEAILLIRRHEYERAADKFRRQLTITSENDLFPKRSQCITLWRMIQTYILANRPDSVRSLAYRMNQLSRTYGIKDTEVDACRLLADYYSRLGDKKTAEVYQLAYYRSRDSLLVDRKLGSIESSYLLNDLNDVKRQVNTLKQNRRIYYVVATSVSVIAIVTLIFLLIIIKKNKRLMEHNRFLYERNRQTMEEDAKQQASLKQMKLKITELEKLTGDDKQTEHLKYQKSNLKEDDKQILLVSIRQALENMDEVCSPDFSIDRLAELCGAPSKSVSQVINEKYGSSFSALLRLVRCRAACRYFEDDTLTGKYTIEAIGAKVGFKSRTGFIRAFKACIGLTPSEYLHVAEERRKAGK